MRLTVAVPSVGCVLFLTDRTDYHCTMDPNLIIAFISSGVTLVTTCPIAVFVTLRSTRDKAKADAMAAVQDVYQETISDLRSDRQQMRLEFNNYKEESSSQIQLLKLDVLNLQCKVEELEQVKCYNHLCKVRQHTKS